MSTSISQFQPGIYGATAVVSHHSHQFQEIVVDDDNYRYKKYSKSSLSAQYYRTITKSENLPIPVRFYRDKTPLSSYETLSSPRNDTAKSVKLLM